VPTALHLSPHPDDEGLGAPVTLLLLVARGWRVVNLACTLGRAEQHARRRRELSESCRRLGLESEVVQPPVAMSVGAGDDLDAARRELAGSIASALARLSPTLLIGPAPSDAHPAHAMVASAAADALTPGPAPTRWWQWSLWSDHPSPNLITPVSPEHIEAASHALEAHAGELARTDYHTLLRARAEVAGVVADERVFGFGSRRESSLPPAPRPALAELLCDLERDDGPWRPRPPRLLDADTPLGRKLTPGPDR